MILFRDILSEDELFTDSNKYAELEGYPGLIKVVGSLKSESSGIDDSMIGGNKSAEGGCEDVEDAAVVKCDIVRACKLEETFFPDKKSFTLWMKDYAKKVVAKLKEEGKTEEEVAQLKKDLEQACKYILKNFKNYSFYTGEKNDIGEGCVCFLDFEEDGITPFMLFFKAGSRSEKC